MTGRARLPSGEPRKASQRKTRPATPPKTVLLIPTWRPGDRVRWQGYTGIFLRHIDDEEGEFTTGERVYRRRVVDLH
jgi:hypothetical protein